MSLSFRDFRGAGAMTITPSDTTVFAAPVWRIYVGVTGNVKVDTPIASGVVYNAVPAGTYIYPNATKVYATNTTASDLVGET
jgi:hypothetical protein